MKDLKHYLSLATILSFAFGAFWVFNYHRQIQILVIIATGIVYVLWGLVHHTIKNDLHWRIVVEYVAVAMIACVAVIFLLLRT
ncbi:hypothetical protein ACFL0Y_02090 [Patescibacteria group bacterium]